MLKIISCLICRFQSSRCEDKMTLDVGYKLFVDWIAWGVRSYKES